MSTVNNDQVFYRIYRKSQFVNQSLRIRPQILAKKAFASVFEVILIEFFEIKALFVLRIHLKKANLVTS